MTEDKSKIIAAVNAEALILPLVRISVERIFAGVSSGFHDDNAIAGSLKINFSANVNSALNGYFVAVSKVADCLNQIIISRNFDTVIGICDCVAVVNYIAAKVIYVCMNARLLNINNRADRNVVGNAVVVLVFKVAAAD